jgi:hypothetical protein
MKSYKLNETCICTNTNRYKQRQTYKSHYWQNTYIVYIYILKLIKAEIPILHTKQHFCIRSNGQMLQYFINILCSPATYSRFNHQILLSLKFKSRIWYSFNISPFSSFSTVFWWKARVRKLVEKNMCFWTKLCSSWSSNAWRLDSDSASVVVVGVGSVEKGSSGS